MEVTVKGKLNLIVGVVAVANLALARHTGCGSCLDRATACNVRNTKFSGFRGGIGILNASNLETINVLVENSSLSDSTGSVR